MAAVRDIRTCLPLLASVLGADYGVEVRIGGENAYTDGRVIHIPDLPLDAAPEVVRLALGFLDHEASHVRETDFEAFRAAGFNPVQHQIFNSLEDHRAEHKLAAVFPGCRENFDFLIRELFMGKDEIHAQAGEHIPAFAVLDYLLLCVRSWDVPEVAPVRTAVVVDRVFPGLRPRLDAVLTRCRTHCPDTRSAIRYTEELWDILEGWGPEETEENDTKQNENRDDACTQSETALEPLLTASADDLPKDLGEAVGDILHEQAPEDDREALRVADVGDKHRQPLAADQIEDIARQTTRLRIRLQRLLQAQTLIPCVTGRRGRLDPRRLHRLSCDDARLFRKNGLRLSLDTAVHLLLDASSSMQGPAMRPACAACYAAAAALQGLHGVNAGVTVFPAAYNQGYPGMFQKRNTACRSRWSSLVEHQFQHLLLR